MPGKLHLVESQAPLSAPVTQVASAGQGAAVVLWVVGDEQRVARVLLETLHTVPGHVLEGEESAVGREEHVEVAGADDGVICVLDNALKDAVLRGPEGGIAEIHAVFGAAENVGIGALLPVGADGSIDSGLHVRAVEIDDFARRNVVADVDAAEDRPGVRAGFADMVEVEAGVHFYGGIECEVEGGAFVGREVDVRILQDGEAA